MTTWNDRLGMTSNHDGLGCEWIELDYPDGWQSKHKTPEQRAELVRRGEARRDGQDAPLDDKVDFAVRCLDRAFKKPTRWYLAFSAGNDSTVLSYICVHMLNWKIPHLMSNTRLEYQQTIRNAKRWGKWLKEREVPFLTAYPDARPAEVWREFGLPLFSKEIATKYRQWFATGNRAHLRTVPKWIIPSLERLRAAGIEISEKCCDELKKKPMKRLAKRMCIGGAITGSRAEESEARKLAYLQRGALYHSTRNNQWICNPLVHWTADDIHEFQQKNGIYVEQIPTASGRSGCRVCGFGCHIDQKKGQQNSLQELQGSCPKLWETAMDKWGFREACDIAGIETERE